MPDDHAVDSKEGYLLTYLYTNVFSLHSVTCLPLWIRFLRRTGVLPVVTQTPASVLL